jgi:hypothetical protein
MMQGETIPIAVREMMTLGGLERLRNLSLKPYLEENVSDPSSLFYFLLKQGYLTYMCKDGHSACVKCLMEKSKKNLRRNENNTLLMCVDLEKGTFIIAVLF